MKDREKMKKIVALVLAGSMLLSAAATILVLFL